MIWPRRTVSVPEPLKTGDAMKIYTDAQIDRRILDGKQIAVLGFGAQGRAQALNLKESGMDVVVGLRGESESATVCAGLGLRVVSLEDAANADIVVMLVPDQAQAEVYQRHLAGHMRPDSAIVFAHGYNIRYQRIVVEDTVDVILVAPLGIGDQVRKQYAQGRGVPALFAIHHDASGHAQDKALAYAAAVGHGRAAIMETSFAEETETDLFAEQAVLSGGLTHLITAAYETLTEAGYSQEIAYFCCLHEVKLMADMIHARGIAGMRSSISTPAEYGDYTRGPRVIGAETKQAMRDMLAEIQDGRFSDELDREIAAGSPQLETGRRDAQAHTIESVGAELRALMPWLDKASSGE